MSRVEKISRQMGTTEATCCVCKERDVSISPSKLFRLRQLQAESSKLSRSWLT